MHSPHQHAARHARHTAAARAASAVLPVHGQSHIRAARALRHLVCALAAVAIAFAATGCDKKPAANPPAAAANSAAERINRPVHEQLMALLEDAQRQRLQLAQARAALHRLKQDCATAKATNVAALAAADAELAEMKKKFQATQTAAATPATASATAAASTPPAGIEHTDGITYSAEKYRHLVTQKINARKTSVERIARFDARHNSVNEQLQNIGIKISQLEIHERDIRDNIGEVLNGHEVSSLQRLVKNIGDTDVAAITKAVVEMETSGHTLLGEAAHKTSAAPATAADLAEADAYLNAKK